MPPTTNTTKKVDINAVNAITGKSNAQVLADAKAVNDQTYAQGNTAFKGSSYDTPIIANTPVNNTPLSTDLTKVKPVVIPTTTPNTPTISSQNLSAPIGTNIDATGNALVTPPTETPAKTAYQSFLEQFGKLGDTLKTKSDVTKNLQEETQLAQKTQQATSDYNTYNKAKLDLAQNIEKMRTTSVAGTASGNEARIADFERRGNANLANLAVVAQASQGLESAARQTIKDSLDAIFQPIQDQIDFGMKFAQLNQNDLSESDKFKLQQVTEQKKTDLANISKTANELKQTMVQNGAPANVLGALDRYALDYADGKISADEAQTKMYQAAGSFGVDKSQSLDIQYKQAQINNVYDQIKERNVSAGGSGVVSGIVSENVGLANLPSEKKNQAILTSLLTGKIGQGTRTQIANVLGVMQATEILANERQTTGFKGISPFNAILNAKIPFTNIGLPFREAAKSQEAVQNAGYIEAINLKVQQWASGASLTKDQTEQVSRFTPRVTDTDNQVRTKLNNLYDFMLGQAQSQLQSEGITFRPEKTNLFEVYDLIQKASPEQLSALRAQGLIK